MEEINEMELSSWGSEKFKVVSKIYGDKFATVTIIVLNTETGELKKSVFKNENVSEYDYEVSSEASEASEASEDSEASSNDKIPGYDSYEREIAVRTVEGLRDEIEMLRYKNPSTNFQNVWNHALFEAANCCNGYEEED